LSPCGIREQKKAVRGETSSAKVISFFTKLGSKSDDAVLAAEDAFAFQTVKYHSTYKTTDCTPFLSFCCHTLAAAHFENFLTVDALPFHNGKCY
jgi:hypothetical protein